MIYIFLSAMLIAGLMLLNDFAMRYYVEHLPKKLDADGEWKPYLDFSVLSQWCDLVFILGWVIGVAMALGDGF